MEEDKIQEEVLPQDEPQAEEKLKETIQKIRESVREEDPKPSSQLNLRTILGGDLLTTDVVRSQIWLFVLIVAFSIIDGGIELQWYVGCAELVEYADREMS